MASIETFNINIDFDLLFETKFLFYSIIRQLNETIKIKENLTQKFLQNLNFSTLEEFVEFFQKDFDKEKLKELIINKANETDIIKTIKPKIYFLHKLMNLILTIFINWNYFAKNKLKKFQIKILYKNDYIKNEFLEKSGKFFKEILQENLKIYMEKNFFNKKENKISENFFNFEFICIEKKSNFDLDSEKEFNIFLTCQMENLFSDFFEKIGNLVFNFNEENNIEFMKKNLNRYLFVHKSLPKSENIFNLENYENILKKKFEKLIDFDVRNSAIEIFGNFVKENVIENEEKVFENLLKRLINDNDKNNYNEINENENANKEIDSKFYLKNFIKFNENFFNRKSFQEIIKESLSSNEKDFNKENDNDITRINLLENSENLLIKDLLKNKEINISYFSNAFLNLNNYGEFIFKYNNNYLNHEFSYLNTWEKISILPKKVEMVGNVTHGFQRGSKMLGIPTANIKPNDINVINGLINGVYFGDFLFKENPKNIQNLEVNRIYKGVLSIGYNPQFDNLEKSIEVFLIDFEGEDFYDYKVKLDISGFIRTEAAFENFEELVTSISYDIIVANKIFDKNNN